MTNIQVCALLLSVLVILRLHYRSGPNPAELNHAGPAVQTMLAWFGPAHFSSVLLLFTLWADSCWPTKICQCKRSISWHLYTDCSSDEKLLTRNVDYAGLCIAIIIFELTSSYRLTLHLSLSLRAHIRPVEKDSKSICPQGICRMKRKNRRSWMIMCDTCQQRFHFKCVNMTQAWANINVPYVEIDLLLQKWYLL